METHPFCRCSPARWCDRSVIALKAHPTHIDSMDMLRDPSLSAAAASLPSLHLNVTRKPQYAKCASPLPWCNCGYARPISCHMGRIQAPRQLARSCRWQGVRQIGRGGEIASSGLQARAPCAVVALGSVAARVLRSKSFCISRNAPSAQFKHAWFHYGRLKAVHNARLLVVSFEDLVDRQKREGVLREMVEFADARPKPTDDATLRVPAC